jgi:AbrB family looped-hinge helix DNA binding protein
MPIATLTTKKQITIPAQIARLWDLKQGDGIMFITTTEEDGSIRVFPIKRKALLGMRGSVKPKKPVKSMEELRKIAREERASRHVRAKSER